MDATFNTAASVIHPLQASCMGTANSLWIKRDDLIHPIVSGNKWRKLKYNILLAQSQGKTRLLTFGGAYSNHLLATACAGATFHLRTLAFVRGHEDFSNHYLRTAALFGMKLIKVSREDYRDKEGLLQRHFPEMENLLVIPEGGESPEAETGIAEIIAEIPEDIDLIVHASATATTATGLCRGIAEMHRKHKVLSIAVLKNAAEQRTKLEDKGFAAIADIMEGYELGGYAKTNEELMQFCRSFIRETGILIDPVYTGKALFTLKEMITRKVIPPDQKILFLHTGGSMGIFSEKFLGQTTNHH